VLQPDESRTQLALANRILAHEGILDGFGHVSMRHPDRPEHFLLACSRAPELVQPSDILEFDAHSEPVQPTSQSLYIERFIHGEIYRARPDVQAISHHHAPGVLPFCIAGVPIVPVYQHGAMIGQKTPFWDSRDEFGDTNLLIMNREQGASLARALGPYWMVLMRHHGATVVGTSLIEMVFRSVTACRNAEFLLAARSLGPVAGLTPGEIEKGGNVSPAAIGRAWEYWVARLPAGGALPG
jgi:HCOMODA/2-hydroxy-3-carboxy-muconic semialdehyde decarboxylase